MGHGRHKFFSKYKYYVIYSKLLNINVGKVSF